MDFKHYIFTRYNLGLYSGNPYKIEDIDNYMKSRLNLFYSHLAGLEEQTNQNFTSLVCVDLNTPSKYLDEIVEAITSTACDIKMIHELPEEWLRKQNPKAPWLITSRLDNDDYYLPGFVETIQSNFKQRTIVYDIVHVRVKGEQRTTQERRFNNSPFTTLIEPWTKDIQTIFHGRGHTDLPRHFKCVRLSNEPLAICNVHGTNAYYK